MASFDLWSIKWSREGEIKYVDSIFWDISKWHRGQKKWDRESIYLKGTY